MAKRGRFSGGTGYAGIPAQIINQIRSQASGINTSATTDTIVAPSETVKKEPRMLTAEEIAADPVLSGRLSIDQAKIRYIRAQQALNLMPGQSDTGKTYANKLNKANKAISKLGFDPVAAERNYFALGGSMEGKGSSSGANYGWSAKKILDYWRSAGMEDKGYEIVAKIHGYDRYGNPVEGGASKNTVDYTLRNEQLSMLGQTNNLNALQSARLAKLTNLKKSGAELTRKQSANLKRLKRMSNG